MSFQTLGLSEQILKNIQEKGYQKPTPVQQGVIPLALNGKDILAAAQTGTGKTAAFALPILQNFSKSEQTEEFKNPKALILVPTRELAMQIEKNIAMYSKNMRIATVALFGGANIAPQTKKLALGSDIIIATPGRLLDHVKLKNISLSKIEFLVLDEADSMLDMGFIRDIEKVLSLITKKPQTMLFSATLSGAVKRLSETILKKPQLVQVASYAAVADNIKQSAYCIDKDKKSEFLAYLIDFNNWKQALIFCRTKLGAEEIAQDFEARGLKSTSIHSDKTHGARAKALEEFKNGKYRVLVATDLAARGIDITDLPFVVNYDVPNIPTDYIHRIGRTGRAGKGGEAITLLSSAEVQSFKKIEALLGKTIQKITHKDYKPTIEPKIKTQADIKVTSQKNDGGRKKTAGAFGKKTKKESAPRGKRAGFINADRQQEKSVTKKSSQKPKSGKK